MTHPLLHQPRCLLRNQSLLSRGGLFPPFYASFSVASSVLSIHRDDGWNGQENAQSYQKGCLERSFFSSLLMVISTVTSWLACPSEPSEVFEGGKGAVSTVGVSTRAGGGEE